MKPTRRQILKGSLAAPLVLTARQASAWAVSSAAACRFKDADRGDKHPGPDRMRHRADDEWLRVDIDLCEIKIEKNGKWTTLDGEYFLGADKTTYWKLSGDQGKMSAEKTKYTVYNSSHKKTGKKKYGLCYVDDDCNQIGYCWESFGGKCISKSCWMSIKGSKWG